VQARRLDVGRALGQQMLQRLELADLLPERFCAPIPIRPSFSVSIASL
jgi:hypothetical protein